MRYLVIAYDKNGATVNRLKAGTVPQPVQVEDVLCEGSSFQDIVNALQEAFSQEMASHDD